MILLEQFYVINKLISALSYETNYYKAHYRCVNKTKNAIFIHQLGFNGNDNKEKITNYRINVVMSECQTVGRPIVLIIIIKRKYIYT